jgi:hypothetical protein
MDLIRAVLTFLILMATNPAGLSQAGQTEPPRSGPFLRLGAGLGQATSNNTGLRHEGKTGLLGDLQVGTGGRRVQAVFEVDWQAFKLPVPFREDAVSLVYLLGSFQWFPGRQVYVRGGLGVARGNWSGPSERDPENYPAAGLALGIEARTFGRWLAFEGVWRGANGLCFDTCSLKDARLLAVQVLVPFY